jgi:hypothetical protein
LVIPVVNRLLNGFKYTISYDDFITKIINGVKDETTNEYQKVANCSLRFDNFVKRIFCQGNKIKDSNTLELSFYEGDNEHIFKTIINYPFIGNEVSENLIKYVNETLSNHRKEGIDVDSNFFLNSIISNFGNYREEPALFEINYSVFVADDEDDFGEHVSIFYDMAKKKFYISHSVVKALFDITAITSTYNGGSNVDGYDKFEKVLNSFVQRVKIMKGKELYIKNKKTLFKNLLNFNEEYKKVEPKKKLEGINNNYNFVKPSSNIFYV